MHEKVPGSDPAAGEMNSVVPSSPAELQPGAKDD